MGLTLQGITSYQDYMEIRSVLAKSEKADKVSVQTEAPGLMTLDLRWSGETKGLKDEINTALPGKYSITEKGHRSGRTEVIVSKKN